LAETVKTKVFEEMDRAEEIFKRILDQGEAAIDNFILSRTSEELFLDFKRSSDKGTGPVLSQIDRNNLAKAISGFGNFEGGVIVWGVDCADDANKRMWRKQRFRLWTRSDFRVG
jgi:hypothetical protein